MSIVGCAFSIRPNVGFQNILGYVVSVQRCILVRKAQERGRVGTLLAYYFGANRSGRDLSTMEGLAEMFIAGRSSSSRGSRSSTCCCALGSFIRLLKIVPSIDSMPYFY